MFGWNDSSQGSRAIHSSTVPNTAAKCLSLPEEAWDTDEHRDAIKSQRNRFNSSLSSLKGSWRPFLSIWGPLNMENLLLEHPGTAGARIGAMSLRAKAAKLVTRLQATSESPSVWTLIN